MSILLSLRAFATIRHAAAMLEAEAVFYAIRAGYGQCHAGHGAKSPLDSDERKLHGIYLTFGQENRINK